MGRPLRQDVIEAMNIATSKGQLSKQVGFNKYRIKDDDELIVRLAEKEEADNDVVLSLTDGVKEKPVLKIMKHLFQTADESYVYELDGEGHIVFEKEGVSLSVSSDAKQEPEVEAEAEPVVEPSEESVVEPSEKPVVKSKSK